MKVSKLTVDNKGKVNVLDVVLPEYVFTCPDCHTSATTPIKNADMFCRCGKPMKKEKSKK